jgi:GTPase SAR1 family protein
MHTTQTRRRLPKIQFRVLVVGRANAGKTSILQRVCETTESPTIYRGDEEVRGPNFCVRARMISQPTRLNLTRQWKLVAAIFLFGCL